MKKSALKQVKFDTALAPPATNPMHPTWFKNNKKDPENYTYTDMSDEGVARRNDHREALKKNVEYGLAARSGLGLLRALGSGTMFGLNAIRSSGSVSNVMNMVRQGGWQGIKNFFKKSAGEEGVGQVISNIPTGKS